MFPRQDLYRERTQQNELAVDRTRKEQGTKRLIVIVQELPVEGFLMPSQSGVPSGCLGGIVAEDEVWQIRARRVVVKCPPCQG